MGFGERNSVDSPGRPCAPAIRGLARRAIRGLAVPGGGDIRRRSRAAIDATDDGTGKFRVLVKPGAEDEWPSERFLRQGVRANGWVMLSRVRLGYEIWRQLNGFPPVVAKDQAAAEGKEGKTKVPLPK